MTINEVHRRIVEPERKAAREAANKEAAAKLPSFHARYDLRCSSCISALDSIPPDSIDLIITDPPYKYEHLSVYEELSRVGAHVLKPGGLALVMVGHYYLPELVNALGKHLTYHWILSYLTPNSSARVLACHALIGWKPVLIYRKGNYCGKWFSDVATSASDDKKHHQWGQSLSGMRDLMRHFVQPNELVFDPFLGGGTTAVVALALQARFIGFDISPKAIETTKTRIGAELYMFETPAAAL
jgi:DNA modification methylase